MPAPGGRTPDFVVAGHVTCDLVGDERRAGGTASYAAAVALALGLRVSVLTSAPAEFEVPAAALGVEVHRQAASAPTVMEHRWYGPRREQYLRSRAETLAPALLPPAVLAAPVVLFGPVAWEVEPDLVAAFPRALRGATVQGWLRRIAADGHVEAINPAGWDPAPLFAALDAVFLSEEDLALAPAEREALLDRWAQRVRFLAVTRGVRGASLAIEGCWHEIGALPAREVDGTGAGDAFAAGFLIRYHEAADPGEAARFATAVASFVVEAPGTAGAPNREQVLARMDAFPDVRLRPRGGG